MSIIPIDIQEDPPMSRRAPFLAVLLAVTALAVAACGSSSSKAASASPSSGSAPTTVHLGYFPNITHATAIIGVEKGIFAKDLGGDKLETATFNAGPAATEALLSGAIEIGRASCRERAEMPVVA